ncbi:MAG: cytochrome b/b6 domain-containing protein [Sedimentisphaerales bacterium]|nr:cytochrome b/b6 domain-containing protein [Sedimentisphaerales bacterium]
MFQVISITGFIIVFAGLAFHCLVFPVSGKHKWGPVAVLKKLIHLLTVVLIPQQLSLLGVLRKLLYLLTLLCFVVLVVTGFYRPLVMDEHLSGYLLMIHATFAPIFAICVAILAIMWAHHNRFETADWPWLLRVLRRFIKMKTIDEQQSCGRSYLVQKIAFWLIIFLALPVILSIVLGMFPIFGTEGQEFLLNLHRYSTLALTLTAIIHIYLIIRTQMK